VKPRLFAKRKNIFDIGFVVNAIERPDGSIAHDQDQLSALHRGFDDLALKLAEKRTPRNRGETTEATAPLDTPAREFALDGGFKGGRAHAAALPGLQRVDDITNLPNARRAIRGRGPHRSASAHSSHFNHYEEPRLVT